MKRTAFIAIVGRPNVGKSTLLNALLGEKVAIVSKRPQTTRNRITGIHTVGDDQYIFLDTPGMHKPRTKLGNFMVKEADSTIGEADAAILVVEAREAVGDIEASIIEQFKRRGMRAVLVVNKIDAVTPANIARTIAAYAEAFDFDAVIPTAAKNGRAVDTVLAECGRYLEESVWFFPDDIATDQTERQIAAEVIREKLLRSMEDEIPHGTAVVIEEFKEDKELLRIRATVYCEKNSHKGIIIGKKGAMLKLIGTRARQDMERFFGTKIFLDLWVKVKENWRDSNFMLSDIGYTRDDND